MDNYIKLYKYNYETVCVAISSTPTILPKSPWDIATF